MLRDLDKVSIFVLLNPFIGSGLFNLGTDLSVFWLIATFYLTFRKLSIFSVIFLPTLFFDITLAVYIYAITSISLLNIRKLFDLLPVTVLFWLTCFILEIVFPVSREILFYRSSSQFVGRGLSGFGPEPATTAFFLLSIIILLKTRYRYLSFVLLVLTQVIPIIVVGSIILILTDKRGMQILLLLLIPMVALAPIFNVGERALFYLDVFRELNVSGLMSDASFFNRVRSIPTVMALLKEGSILPLNHLSPDKIEINGFMFSREITSGILRLYNYFGLFILLLIPRIFRKMTLAKSVVLVLSLFAGSPAHIFPALLLFRKLKYG